MEDCMLDTVAYAELTLEQEVETQLEREVGVAQWLAQSPECVG